MVNVTEPVAPLGRSVSVKMTGLPGRDGLGEEFRVDVEFALVTF